MLTLNYTVKQVILYFMVFYGACFLASFLAIYVAGFIGLQRTIILRIPFIIITLILLFSLTAGNPVKLFVIAIIGGIQNMFYWIPLHLLFARNVEKRKDLLDEFFVFREVPVFIGRISILLIAFFLADNIAAVFPIAGLAYLYFLFL